MPSRPEVHTKKRGVMREGGRGSSSSSRVREGGREGVCVRSILLLLLLLLVVVVHYSPVTRMSRPTTRKSQWKADGFFSWNSGACAMRLDTLWSAGGAGRGMMRAAHEKVKEHTAQHSTAQDITALTQLLISDPVMLLTEEEEHGDDEAGDEGQHGLEGWRGGQET
jgi:hypothetical protein